MINVLIQPETSWCNNNLDVCNYFAKEVQTTLPSHSKDIWFGLVLYIFYIFEKSSQYHKHFRAALLSAPPQVDTYHLTNIQGYFTGLLQFPNQKENPQIVKKIQPKQGGFLHFASMCVNSS